MTITMKILNYIHTLTFCLISVYGLAQVGINTNTPDPSALLDIKSDNKGLLLNKVQLQSRKDITTIPNPSKGLLVINIADSGTGISKIYGNTLYMFNGTAWEEVLINNINRKNFLFPKIAAMGRKTTESNCTGLNSNTFQLDPLTFLQYDGNILHEDGSITAKSEGYYAWSIQMVQKMKKDSYDPYFSPGLITYAFRSGTTSTESNQFFTFSGTVYLEENKRSDPFKWHLGDSGQACTSSDLIGNQVVVWRYIGD